MRKFLVACVFACGGFSFVANAQPKLEDYAAPPAYRNAVLSDDGDQLAVIASDGDKEVLCIYDLNSGQSDCVLEVTDLKPRNLIFAGDEHVVLVASEMTSRRGYRGDFEYASAFSVKLGRKRITQLINRTEDLHPAQEGLGRILAMSDDGEEVYMPAYIGRTDTARYSLVEGQVDSDRGKVLVRGLPYTRDWFVEPDGDVLARIDYDNESNIYSVHSYSDGSATTIFEQEVAIPELAPVGLTPDRSELVILSGVEGSDMNGLFLMRLSDGEVSGPFLHEVDKEIDSVLIDENRVVHGVRYSGTSPSYAMLDPDLNSDLADIVEGLKPSSVSIASWSEDWSRILLFVSAGEFSGQYLLYDRGSGGVSILLDVRPNVSGTDVAQSSVISYKARDGLDIPAIVTWPPGLSSADRKDLPMVVLPHGGPASYDQVGFDWMAQYFASQGYVVFQPNFRGSSGFGRSFQDAGKGEWGRAMQDDISDGVSGLVRSGWVDEERICIVGWSYGGYAALAGGAYTPDLYKCVVSIAGVSDLPVMLIDDLKSFGRDHWVYDYWTESIGDVREARDQLEEVSPKYKAEAFQAPVLLIHGDQDQVVDARQSRRMEDALKDAGKSVDLIILRGQDHSLSTRNSRVDAMKEIISFVDKALQP
ncbi:MAG: S9 family peptidase [Ponticaulis sp.]|nr:S9 family peptidase [Ponticaulis sp.]